MILYKLITLSQYDFAALILHYFPATRMYHPCKKDEHILPGSVNAGFADDQHMASYP